MRTVAIDMTQVYYNRGVPKSSHPEADAIRRQVLTALAENRAPGFHFPGHLLAPAWPRIGVDDLEEVMPDGPHARNVDGSVDLAAFCVHLDTALATASRLKLERGELTARTRMNGYATGATARESLTSGTVYALGAPVCHASATFIGLPPPPGVNLAPLPWQRESGAPIRCTPSSSASGACRSCRPTRARAAP
jgi:hypothetical protein